jgi:ABC-2 type transport system ATP-binding protein
MAMIETQELSKTYGADRALHRITVSLEPGQPIGLVGPNGAGKTTFFSLLCGFLHPTSGTVRVLGYPPLHKALHGRIAILPQDAALIKTVPILTQLTFLAQLQGFTREKARQEAQRVLECVNLHQSGHKSPDLLSHGMLKRAAIAQAFIGSTELVLLDEPTAGLDPATAGQIRELIRTTAKDRTFIVSSHNLSEIEDICGSVLILNRGQLTEYKTISDIVARTTCLTFRLENAPEKEEVEVIFQKLPEVTQVEIGSVAKQQLLVHYHDSADKATHIRIMQVLHQAGISFLEMSRGQSLENKVLEITQNK